MTVCGGKFSMRKARLVVDVITIFMVTLLVGMGDSVAFFVYGINFGEFFIQFLMNLNRILEVIAFVADNDNVSVFLGSWKTSCSNIYSDSRKG